MCHRHRFSHSLCWTQAVHTGEDCLTPTRLDLTRRRRRNLRLFHCPPHSEAGAGTETQVTCRHRRHLR
ncbi:hypothetical protein INR49_009572 [Caranx melampygus]|nr:hypothetical protein INR49_009572 [Caranx melampygus]